MIQANIKSKLILVGDGPELQTAYEIVNKLNLENNVLFLGKQKNISDLLSISDIKLLMSEQESFGLVLLEAMACEVAAIGTNVGGIPEVISHGETGYIVELGDTETAASYAIHLLENEDLLKEFSEQALHRARSLFHSEEIVNQYIALYEKLLIKNGSGE